jgi:hypothetical protein
VTPVSGDPKAPNALENATEELIRSLQKENPNMRIERKTARVRLNGEPGLSTYLVNDSPAGGQETDWLITVIRFEGLVFFVCVAPQKDYQSYDRTFAAILDSVRFPK